MEKTNRISQQEFNQLSEKITRGINLAVQRLIDRTKQEDGELVISKNGKVIRIKARDLK